MGRATVLVVAPTAKPLRGLARDQYAERAGLDLGVDHAYGEYDDPEQPRSGLAEDVAASWEETLRGLSWDSSWVVLYAVDTLSDAAVAREFDSVSHVPRYLRTECAGRYVHVLEVHL